MDDDSAEVRTGRDLELFERATAGRLARGEDLDSHRRFTDKALHLRPGRSLRASRVSNSRTRWIVSLRWGYPLHGQYVVKSES
jgi:hypothetical protein